MVWLLKMSLNGRTQVDLNQSGASLPRAVIPVPFSFSFASLWCDWPPLCLLSRFPPSASCKRIGSINPRAQFLARIECLISVFICVMLLGLHFTELFSSKGDIVTTIKSTAQFLQSFECVDDMSWRDSNHPGEGCVHWSGYNCSEVFDPWPGPNDHWDPPDVVLEKCPKTCNVCRSQTDVNDEARSYGANVNVKYLDAALASIDEVNIDQIIRSKELASGRLVYDWENSGCSPSQALEAMGKLLARRSRIDAVIGPDAAMRAK